MAGAVKIRYPAAEKRWAESVKAVIEKGLPELEAAAGFAMRREPPEVRFAFGPGETEGYEAMLKPDALYVRKACARYGYHGHWVLYGLARAMTEEVVRPEWLRAGLAHLLIYQTLKKLPAVYDARTYRDEILDEMKKATDEAPLDQWTPMPPGGAAAAAPPEQPVPVPQVAKAFGFLYLANAMLDGAVRKAAGELHKGANAVGTRDFIAAVGAAAGGKKVDEYFIGWGYADPTGSGPPPKLDRTDLLDSDDDGLLNFEETKYGTDKTKADTDGDGVSDGEEIEAGTDPKVKDAPKSKVRIDGDGKEWMRLKKFTFQDKQGDAKEKITGADIRAVKVCADAKYMYLLIEVDSFDNLDVAYQFCFDTGDDAIDANSNVPEEQRKVVWNYIIGFRGDRMRWIVDTHNDKDLSWAEAKNHRRFALAIKEQTAELRLPLDLFELPPKFLMMAYTTAKDGSLVTDGVARQMIELDMWRH